MPKYVVTYKHYNKERTLVVSAANEQAVKRFTNDASPSTLVTAIKPVK